MPHRSTDDRVDRVLVDRVLQEPHGDCIPLGVRGIGNGCPEVRQFLWDPPTDLVLHELEHADDTWHSPAAWGYGQGTPDHERYRPIGLYQGAV